MPRKKGMHVGKEEDLAGAHKKRPTGHGLARERHREIEKTILSSPRGLSQTKMTRRQSVARCSGRQPPANIGGGE